MELLRSLNFDVQVVPSSYHEPPHPYLAPRELAILHARHKCEDVRIVLRQAQDDNAAQDDKSVIVAADTVVDLDGIPYNKPSDEQEAKSMLRDLSGRTHIVHTAFALSVPGREQLIERCESTFVTFYQIDDAEIDAYVASKEPMDKAGAYGIQGYGATLVERVEGDFYTVMGFPLGRFVRTMRRLGFVLPITNVMPEDRQ